MSIGRFGPAGLRRSNGNPVGGTTVPVYEAGTNTLADLYADVAGETPLSNPSVTDAYGNFTFCAEAGNYDLAVNGGRIMVPVDPAPAGGGGGSFELPTLAEIGDVCRVDWVSAGFQNATLLDGSAYFSFDQDTVTLTCVRGGVYAVEVTLTMTGQTAQEAATGGQVAAMVSAAGVNVYHQIVADQAGVDVVGRTAETLSIPAGSTVTVMDFTSWVDAGGPQQPILGLVLRPLILLPE